MERRMVRRQTAPAGNGNGRGGGARNLVIVESPAKARTVENILGSDYRVIASVGHVRDLPNYGYGVKDLKNGDFTPVYVVPKEKRAVVEDIRAAARELSGCTSRPTPTVRARPSRGTSLRPLRSQGKATRVVFHEVTKPAIEAAFREAQTGHAPAGGADHHRKKPGELDMTLVDAQQARRVLDRLIGFPLTWFVQKKVARSASAGRVQSVALRLIVEREREIQDFRATEWWSIHAQLAKTGRQFEAELAKLPDQERGLSLKPPFDERRPAIGSQEQADALVGVFRRSDFTVASVKKGERSKGPVPPFTTSTFQQAAVNRLGMSAARAMSVAQQLYEGAHGQSGLITYMRTDSLNISPVARGEARRYIADRWGKDYVPEKERVYRTRSAAPRRRTRPSAPPTSGAPRRRCATCSIATSFGCTRSSGSGSSPVRCPTHASRRWRSRSRRRKRGSSAGRSGRAPST
jgi:DNA topoisomerase-1